MLLRHPTGDRKHDCHISLLKPYYACDALAVVCVASQVSGEDEESEDDEVGAAEQA